MYNKVNIEWKTYWLASTFPQMIMWVGLRILALKTRKVHSQISENGLLERWVRNPTIWKMKLTFLCVKRCIIVPIVGSLKFYHKEYMLSSLQKISQARGHFHYSRNQSWLVVLLNLKTWLKYVQGTYLKPFVASCVWTLHK